MRVRLVNNPYILYETAGMVSMYYTKRSFVKIAEHLAGKFGSVLSNKQISALHEHAVIADDFLNEACADLDMESEEVKFFFKPFDTGRQAELNCAARVALTSFMKLTSPDFDTQVQEIKQRWRDLKKEGVMVVDFTNAGIAFALTKGRSVPTLFEQIYSLQYPHDAKLDAYRVLDNLDYYVDRLAALLRPYAERLEAGLDKLRPIYAHAAESWSIGFDNITAEQFASLIRIDHSNRFTHETTAGFSLFFFNEIGFGYEPGTDDKIATLYIGAGVFPEFTNGYVEKRADRLSETMKAFTDPVKLEMLSRLCHEPDYCLNIAQKMNINAGNASRHLTGIYDMGLLFREKLNNRTYYRTDVEAVKRVLSDILVYISSSEK